MPFENPNYFPTWPAMFDQNCSTKFSTSSISATLHQPAPWNACVFRPLTRIVHFSPCTSMKMHLQTTRMCSPKEPSNCSQIGRVPNSCILKDRHPNLLDKCVHLLNIGCVRAILTLFHHDVFHCQLLCANCMPLCNLCETKFSKISSDSPCRPRRHRVLVPPMLSSQLLPTSVLQQTNTKHSNLVPQMHRTPWKQPQATGLMNVSVKLFDEILNLPCQLELPANPMVLCTLMSNWTVALLLCDFILTWPRPDCLLLLAKNLLTPLVQKINFNTFAPEHPESLRVTQLLPPAHSHWNSDRSSSCAHVLFAFVHIPPIGKHQPRERVLVCRWLPPNRHRNESAWRYDLLTLHRFCFQLPYAHVAEGSKTDASHTTAAQSARPSTSMADRTTKEKTRLNIEVCHDHDGHHTHSKQE